MLLQPGANSRSIFLGLVRGLAKAGHEPLVLELAPFWEALNRPGAPRSRVMTESAAVLRELVVRHQPDASIAMWGNALTTFAGGAVEGAARSVFGMLDLPHCCWWLDAPHWAAEGSWAAHFGNPMLRCPSLVHAVNNASTAREMTEVLGFGRSVAIPYAVDEGTFRPRDEPRRYDLVASCGPGDPPPTDRALRELERDEPDMEGLRREAAALATSRLDEAAPHALRPLLRELLASQLEERHAPMLDRLDTISVRSGFAAEAARTLLADPRLYVRATALIRSVEAHERAFTIAWLSRRFNVAVFGAMSDRWPVHGDRLGEIPFEEMARVYCRAAASLNVMRWQDDVGINLKPFEIGACGVPCLMARRAGVSECFEPGEEILLFDAPHQAAAMLRSLQRDESLRESVGRRALSRIRREHTWSHRAGAFLRAMTR
ncbi:hypothetical protein PHYC_00768 [Phycisphaerales bacterium]|nr:hypothetical protein PHYC_00768 [Phycisphaerales bacterium]